MICIVKPLENDHLVVFTSLPSSDGICRDLRGRTGQNFWGHRRCSLGKYAGWGSGADLLAVVAL
jgi:hypothetical protein